jgi:hypothetical protein
VTGIMAFAWPAVVVVQLMIEKGANTWNRGLSLARHNRHVHLMQLMIEKGASNLEAIIDYPQFHILMYDWSDRQLQERMRRELEFEKSILMRNVQAMLCLYACSFLKRLFERFCKNIWSIME